MSWLPENAPRGLEETARRWRQSRYPRLAAGIFILVLILLAYHSVRDYLQTLTPAGLPEKSGVALSSLRLASSVVAVFIIGALVIWLVRQVSTLLAQLAGVYVGDARAHGLATFVSFLGYLLFVPLIAAWVLGVDLSGLALGGAVTGVVVGIAAQASLGNLISGLVILFARPYVYGMHITARSPQFAGSEYSGRVDNISLFYTTLYSGERDIRIPNSAMIGSTITVRPELIDVSIPLVLGAQVNYAAALERILDAVGHALPDVYPARIFLERADAAGFAIVVNLSLPDLTQRAHAEAALAAACADLLAVPPAVPAAPSAAPTTSSDTETDQPSRPTDAASKENVSNDKDSTPHLIDR